mgnify:CR=1 FL=1
MAAPIYLKIKERLMEDIRDKSVSTPIDSERELAVKFDVSRMTVRRAVNELVAEGYLYRNKTGEPLSQIRLCTGRIRRWTVL